MAPFQLKQRVKIVAGVYKSKHATIMKFTDSGKSVCVKVEGDSVQQRTIRLSSIAAIETTQEKVTISKQEYEELLDQVATLSTMVKKLQITVNSVKR